MCTWRRRHHITRMNKKVKERKKKTIREQNETLTLAHTHTNEKIKTQHLLSRSTVSLWISLFACSIALCSAYCAMYMCEWKSIPSLPSCSPPPIHLQVAVCETNKQTKKKPEPRLQVDLLQLYSSSQFVRVFSLNWETATERRVAVIDREIVHLIISFFGLFVLFIWFRILLVFISLFFIQCLLSL